MFGAVWRWVHRNKMGREYQMDKAMAEQAGLAVKMIDLMFRPGPLYGLTSVRHEFVDHYVSLRHPAGTWRVTIEQVKPPPAGKVVDLKRRRR